MDRLHWRLSALARRIAPALVTLDGLAIVVVGAFLILGSSQSVQGEQLGLLIGGIALMLLGGLMALHWNLGLVRSSLIGFTTGYFAIAITEFGVRTDPCDLGSRVASCAGHVVADVPWEIYNGPLLLAALLFVFLALAPVLGEPRRPSAAATPA